MTCAQIAFAMLLLFSHLLANSQTTTTNPSVTGVASPQSSVAITGGTITGTSVSATTLSASGVITPTYPAGIVGNTSGSTTAGSIGQNSTSNVTSGSLSSGVQTNVTSIAVTAGNWLVFGFMNFIPAASTLVANDFGGFSTTSASLTNYISFVPVGAGATGVQYGFELPTQFYSLSGSGTIYCITNMIFSVSTATAQCVMTVIRIS